MKGEILRSSNGNILIQNEVSCLDHAMLLIHLYHESQRAWSGLRMAVVFRSNENIAPMHAIHTPIPLEVLSP
jgi:hypothetical protein